MRAIVHAAMYATSSGMLRCWRRAQKSDMAGCANTSMLDGPRVETLWGQQVVEEEKTALLRSAQEVL